MLAAFPEADGAVAGRRQVSASVSADDGSDSHRHSGRS